MHLIAPHVPVRLFGLTLLLSLLLCAWASAQETIRATHDAQGYTVENKHYRLVIDDQHGASVRSLIVKSGDSPKEWIYPAGGGLLQDMIWQQPHPGELQDNAYEHRVLEQTPTLFRAEFWRALKVQPYDGLVFRKIVTLRADSPAIHVRMTLENPTDRELFPGAWVQNRFFCGGQKGVQVVYRSSYLGVRVSFFDGSNRTGDEFVRKPSAGWTMTFDRDSGAGMLGLVDYNYLQMHYSCLPAYTTEFFFDRVLLRPGNSWSSEYTLVPVTGVKNCFYADSDVFVTASQSADTVTLNFRATDRSVPRAHVTVRAESSDRSAVLAEKSVELTDIDNQVGRPIALTVPGLSTAAAVLSLSMRVGDAERSTEFAYSRDTSFYHLQETAVTFRAKLPKKIKPELAEDRTLVLQPHEGLRVWYAAGLWHEMNRVIEALREIDPNVKVDITPFRTGTLGPELLKQPLLAEELLGYDLLVMNNVGSNALGDAGEIAVQQYVRAGGKLLVCGGLYGLGKSRWSESPLADDLPVTVRPFWDLSPLPEFTPIQGAAGAVRWVQRPATIKPDARVLWRAGDEPVLISRPSGKGRVLIWLGTPMGEPPAGTIPYWQSPGWVPALRGVLAEAIARPQTQAIAKEKP